MKILNFILAVLFLVFAGVQINDPDPILWVMWYVFLSILFFFAGFGKYNIWIIRVGIFISIAWLATLIPDFVDWIKMGAPTITESMKAEEPHIELTREFLGLVVSLIVLTFLYFSGKKKTKK